MSDTTTTESARTRSGASYLRNRQMVLRRSRENYEKNKAKRTQQIKAWAESNPDKREQIYKKYREAHRGIMRERCRQWLKKQTQETKAWMNAKRRAAYPKKKDKQRAWWKRYYRENKARLSLRILKRKALKKQASLNLVGIQAFVTSVRQSKSVFCYYCGKKISAKSCHFDHIVPLSKGGPHSADNLCVSCPPCNLSKQDKPLNIWIKVGQQLLSL